MTRDCRHIDSFYTLIVGTVAVDNLYNPILSSKQDDAIVVVDLEIEGSTCVIIDPPYQ